MGEWREQALSDVLELQRGHDLPSADRLDGDVPIIGSFGITGTHHEARYEGPGVAIGRSGASIGVATYVDAPYWPLNTCLFVKDFKGNSPRWVYHLLQMIDFHGFNSGSAQPSLNRNFLKGIPVRVPCRAEQDAIAEVLGALDDKIAANDRTLALLDSLAEATVDRAVRDVVPRQLREVAELRYGKALPVAERTPGAVVVYGSGGQLGAHDCALVSQPGIVVGRKGTVGAVYWADGPHYPIDTTYYVVPRGGVTAHALFYALRNARLSELNSDSAVPGLNRDEAYVQWVRVPAEAGSGDLCAQLESAFELARQTRRESAALARTRDQLLPLLMSGKVTVKEAEDEVGGLV